MGAVSLAAGKAIALSVQGRTLSIVNDPTIAMEASYGLRTTDPWSPGVAEQLLPADLPEIEAGTVLVGFDSAPASAAAADAAAPPFSNTTIPIPPGVVSVWLLYPGGNPAYQNIPRFKMARSQASRLGLPSKRVTVWTAWSDAEGPLQVTPTGSILPARIFDQNRSIATLPVDSNLAMIPPSPATTVYDQALQGSRGGPFFRPHIAPSAVHFGRHADGTGTHPFVLNGNGPDPFNPSLNERDQAQVRAILRIIVSLSGATEFQLMTASGSVVIDIETQAAGVFIIDFGEGLAPNFDGSSGQWMVSNTAVIFTTITVLHG